MHTGSHYKIGEFIIWTRSNIYVLLIIAVVPTVAYQLLSCKWVGIPWVLIALVGTAAAFVIGFKFTSMDKEGDVTENPFEGGANDIPMAALCRNIEIDLRHMLDEKDLPAALSTLLTKRV